MFDRLIVSEPDGAGARSRKNYFLVSTFAVGTIVLTAVVASIFAEEVGLGTDNFELAVLLPPVEMPAVQPQPPRQQPQRSQPAQSPSQSQIPTRTELIAPIDRPDRVPATTSVTPSKVPTMPNYQVELGNTNTDPEGRVGRAIEGTPEGSGLRPESDSVAANDPKDEPPAQKPHPPKNQPPKTLGVVNGLAVSLPKPPYPPTALAINVQGKVDVQVLIDETGHVVSAKAVTGHPLLRNAAENAARNARFTPTLLSKVPVKVTGVLVYNFTRG